MSTIEEINYKFKVKLNEEGEIVNVDEFKSNLQQTEMNEEIETYLINLNNRIKNSGFINRAVLSNAIEGKLLEYHAVKNEKIDNKESLKMMTDANGDLKKLGIITTKAENNDSKKDIDYLTFTNEFGVTEMLVCAYSNTLNDYIRNNADKIVNMSAKEVFHHFKEYIHVELNFIDPRKSEEYNTLNHDAQAFQDDEVLVAEYEEVKKYSEKYSLGCLPEVTIDPNGERIYRLKDGLFKFRTFGDKRAMVVLKTPSINLDNTEDLLSELDENKKDYEVVVPTKPTNTDKEAIPNTYGDIAVIEINEENINRAMELIQKRDIYGAELTNDELLHIDRIIKTLIESMVERAKKNSVSDLDQLLYDYINKLSEKKNNKEENDNSQEELTDLEEEFIEKYNSKIEYIKKNVSMKKNKGLSLELNKGASSQHGIATIVMLLEIMLLAIFILLFSHIDI